MYNKVLLIITNILNNPSNKLKATIRSNNTINKMGDSLEEYIKNACANTFNNPPNKLDIYENCFSWTGNQNNPPDIIIKNDIAIEVKKIEGFGSIALNSSYPKTFIDSSSNMITKGCKYCENNGTWKKELVYCIGKVKKDIISDLFIVYGNLYAASEEIYLRIKNKIETGINEIQNVEFTETNELGKVKKVDPLGITDLRIRGMWSIYNPYKVFNYINEIQNSNQSNKDYIIHALLPTKTLNNQDYLIIDDLLKNNSNIYKYDIKIKNPNNPSKLIPCILIRVEIEVI